MASSILSALKTTEKVIFEDKIFRTSLLNAAALARSFTVFVQHPVAISFSR